MKKTITQLLFRSFLWGVFLLSTASVFAQQTFQSIRTGLWQDASTWDRDEVPGPNDDVIIDGDTVYIENATGDLTINSISLTNASGDNTFLYIKGSNTISITGDVQATSENIDKRVELNISRSVSVEIGGNLSFTRTNDNYHNSRLRLAMSNKGQLMVGGDFTFYYGNSDPYEFLVDLYMENQSYFEVAGSTYFQLVAGRTLDITLIDSAHFNVQRNFVMRQDGAHSAMINTWGNSQFSVGANLTLIGAGGTYYNTITTYGSSTVKVDSSLILNSTVADEAAAVFMKSPDSQLKVGQDIVMSANSENDVGINMNDGGQLYIGGNFSRPNKYGVIVMASSGASLTYDGSQQQTMAMDSIAGAGADKFDLTNVIMANTSGMPMLMEGPMVIKDSLVLNNGIIQTDTTNTLTIADGATIVGGGPDAYINGPVTKQGGSPGGTFFFPVGNGGVYAPIELDSLIDPADSYTVRYFNCPPPFGNNLSTKLSHISSLEYWQIEKSAGAPDANIDLNWSDAQARGIDNLASLAVAFYNSATSEWVSLGNGGTSGGVGAGISGSVTNDLNCPPPFGSGINMVTFGSTSNLFNALPVELTRFTAELVGDAVELEWETSAELNNDYFVVERSTDGMNFEWIGWVPASGSADTYQLTDHEPADSYNYYRLKQIDKDGTFYFSEAIVVSLDNRAKPVVFPNPVERELNIYLNGWERSNVQVEIFNEAGRRLYARNFSMQVGTFQISATEIESLVPGFYTLVLRSEGSTESLKFLKK
ncbi:MAG: T9SS type A sorting domain-containing protein [Bacteroidota bacterium]